MDEIIAEERPWPERYFSENLQLVDSGIIKHEYEIEMVGGNNIPISFGINPHIGAWISTIVDGRLVEILIVGPYQDEADDPEHDVILDLFVNEDDPQISINLSKFVQDYPRDGDDDGEL
jgi:hypothetical protein